MTRVGLFCVVLAVSAVLAAPVSAAHQPVLQFSQTLELPSSGLKIKIMSGAVEEPPPPPTTYRYSFTLGEASGSTNFYDAVELWREGQQAGQWRDRFGTLMVMSAVTAPCPGGFSRPHVSPEEYKAAAVPAPAAWTTNSLAKWVGDFCGVDRVTLQPLRHSVRFRYVYRCRLNDGPRHRFGCLVQLYQSAVNGPTGRSSGLWFFVLFDLAEGLPPAQAEEAVFGDFVESLIYVGRSADPRAFVPRISSVRRDGVAHVTPATGRTREQVANSIKNMKNWWFLETKHYIMLSNMKQGGSTLVNRLQTNMEYLWVGFAQLVPAPSPQTFVGVIRVFATPGEYVAYVGPERAWTSGLWSPLRQELVIRPSDSGGTQEKADRLLRVIYHEAFHQYLFQACDGLEASAWFNEGHASLFENARIRNGRMDVDEDPERIVVLLESIRRSPPDLGALLNMSYEQFYAGSDEDRQQRYAMVWAFVYYLRKGADMERVPYAHQVCPRYLEVLWQSKDPSRATRDAFEGIDLKRLTEDFTRFWLSNHKRSGADRNRIITGSR